VEGVGCGRGVEVWGEGGVRLIYEEEITESASVVASSYSFLLWIYSGTEVLYSCRGRVVWERCRELVDNLIKVA
jgi:hypothetical protein